MALSLFEELSSAVEPALVPDLYTYNTVMTVFSRSGMLGRALELLEEAKSRGLSPDVVTYRQDPIVYVRERRARRSFPGSCRTVASPTGCRPMAEEGEWR